MTAILYIVKKLTSSSTEETVNQTGWRRQTITAAVIHTYFYLSGIYFLSHISFNIT